MTISTAQLSSRVPSQVLDMPQLLDRCLGSLDLAERCLVRFEQKLRAELECLQDAVDRDDRTELAQLAHRVKGSAATIAAGGLAQAAAALEAYGRGLNSEEPSGLMADFRSEVERFLDVVPRFSRLGQDPV
jgi:HPt (histidine-containing phosphotransfer) domain-containing protein